jgi:hypothetical protein
MKQSSKDAKEAAWHRQKSGAESTQSSLFCRKSGYSSSHFRRVENPHPGKVGSGDF